MKIIKTIVSILAILLGILMFIFAEIDDSPGGMLLGVGFGAAGVVSLILRIKSN